ncbi:MAG: transposase [Deltaproteobacteria bacterium]|nr:transposase [Deltaproteobacteria bacterium]
MSDYRRLYIPGGSYFFTVVTHERQRLFGSEQRVKELRQAFRYVKTRRPFTIVAAVVLPDHLHCVWQLPDDDCDFSTRWQMIKTAFSRRIPSPVRKGGAKTVWQPRFWEHAIRDEEDFRRHLDYIHYNPVKHGLVAAPVAWPYSSFRKFVGMHWYDVEWGATEPKTLADLECE